MEKPQHSRPEEFSQSVPVPIDKIGWLIGKNGTHINYLTHKSGASISVSDTQFQEFGRTWKYIQLTGSGRSIDRAKKLIHLRFESMEPLGPAPFEPNTSAEPLPSGEDANKKTFQPRPHREFKQGRGSGRGDYGDRQRRGGRGGRGNGAEVNSSIDVKKEATECS